MLVGGSTVAARAGVHRFVPLPSWHSPPVLIAEDFCWVSSMRIENASGRWLGGLGSCVATCAYAC